MIELLPDANCPECRYPLGKGLFRWRCPECGFAFDKYTLVCRASRAKRLRVKRLAFLLVPILIAAPSLIDAMRAILSLPDWVALTITLLLVPVLTLIGYRLLARGEPHYLIFTPEGLLRRSGRQAGVIPWKDIALMSIGDEPPWIELRNGGKWHLFGECLDNLAEYRVLRVAIMAARDHYSHGNGEDDSRLREELKSLLAAHQATWPPRPHEPQWLKVARRGGLLAAALGMVLATILVLESTILTATILSAICVLAIWELTMLWRSDRKARPPTAPPRDRSS